MNSPPNYWECTNETISIQTRNLLNQYLRNLDMSNKAEATITKYKWILERFFSECTILIEELTPKDVQEWLNEFSIGKKPRTIDLFISCLSSFFSFCQEEDHITNVLIKKRWRTKIPKSLPRYLNEHQYARVRLAAEDLSLRNRALILFLFSSGCRRTEVSNLNIQDVDLDTRTAEVIGKGKKIRNVHFSVECALVLKEYLKTRSFEGTDPLFMNTKGRRLLPTGIYEVTRKLGRQIGFEQSLHPHSFRHTFATNLLARGATIEFIADEMGHADLNTTRIYARIPTEDMILAYQNKMG